jgi:hypothetical protein
MNLARNQIILGKVNVLAVIFIVSTSVTSSVMAQILPPLPENLIAESGDGISLFSLGYGAGVANYMCFESLKGNLAKSEGDEILAKYKLWFENQSLYQFDVFAEGYGLEMESFNQTFQDHDCNFSF